MKNNTTQEYDDDIAFKIIEHKKSKNYIHQSINQLNQTQELSQDDKNILENIKSQQELLEQNINFLNNTHRNLNDIFTDLNLDVQRYSINVDSHKKSKSSAIKFISCLFLIGLALALIIYKPPLPKAGVMIGKYYIFEESINNMHKDANKTNLNNIKSKKSQVAINPIIRGN